VTRRVPDTVTALLQHAVAARTTPGAVVEVGTTAEPHWRAMVGRQTYAVEAPAIEADTVYDLASLTKVLATTTLAMQAHASGTLPLETVVGRRWPAFAPRPDFTVGDLLEHAAGFPAHRHLYRSVAGRAAYLSRLAAEPLAFTPRVRSDYSDLGFMLLGLLLEDTGRASLAAQFSAFVDEALDGAEMAYGARPEWRGRVVPTSVDDWRGRMIAGHVHDDNAAAMGGCAGHAGVFGTAAAVGAFARWVLGRWRGAGAPWRQVTSSVVDRFARRGSVPGSSRALGWDTMLPTSSCGTRMSPRAIGHTGFTGTSLWIDPDRELYVVCLTNRVHPTIGDADAIQRLRAALHDAVADAFDRSV
jgi:serine-type D-Ala-D-Ala carboxypeptidase